MPFLQQSGLQMRSICICETSFQSLLVNRLISWAMNSSDEWVTFRPMYNFERFGKYCLSKSHIDSSVAHLSLNPLQIIYIPASIVCVLYVCVCVCVSMCVSVFVRVLKTIRPLITYVSKNVVRECAFTYTYECRHIICI